VTKVVVRAAAPHDSRAAQDIVFASLRAFGIEPEPHGLDADVMTFGAARDGTTELVAEIDRSVVGLAVVNPRKPGVGYLSKLFVDAEQRKRGVGRALLDAAVSDARRRGLSRLELQTRKIFEDAIRLYEVSGWKRGPDPDPSQGPDRTYYLELQVLEFLFDYISPFAYLAWHNVQRLRERRRVEVILKPVVFGALLSRFGQLGPAEIEPKRVYVFKQCLRYAARHGIELRGPKLHPFNSLAALRMSLAEVAGPRQIELVQALFDMIWREGIDGGSSAEIRTALDARGFDGTMLVSRTEDRAVKDALRRNTEDAIARGVFGVPAFFVDSEMFWGNDSLEDVEHALDGTDPLDRCAVADLLARPRGTDRKR